MKRWLFLLVMLCFAGTAYAGPDLATLAKADDGEKKSFMKKRFDWSPSHDIFAKTMGDTGSFGKLKIDRESMKQIKKIAIVGFDVRRGINDAVVTNFPDYEGLANAMYQELVKAFTAGGFEVIGLDKAMNTEAYKKIDFGPVEHKVTMWGGNSHADTALGSKWLNTDTVNSLKSAISFDPDSVKRPKWIAKITPITDVAKELGADAAVIASVRVMMDAGKIQFGFGHNIHTANIDLFRVNDPRLIWSAGMKDFVELKTKPAYTSSSGFFSKSYNFDWVAVTPGVADEFGGVAATAVYKFKFDMNDD